MGVREVTYYEVVCDYAGCGVTTGTRSEFTAWSDRNGAIEDWENGDGWVSDDMTVTYCIDHRPVTCAGCDRIDGLAEHTGGDLFCPKCMPEPCDHDDPTTLMAGRPGPAGAPGVEYCRRCGNRVTEAAS